MSRPRDYRSPEEAARSLGRLLRDDAHARTKFEVARESQQRARLLGALERIDTRPRRHWPLVVALVAAAFACAVVFGWRRTHAALSFAVDGVAAFEGTVISTEAGRASALHFSDGSAFDIAPGARLRVDGSSPTGARLALLEGKAVVAVVHRDGSSWAVTAGPFEVEVTGTRFAASWDPVRQRLVVELYEGAVQVVGSSFSAPVAVRSGQRLEAGVGAGDWLLTSLAGPTPKPVPAPSTEEPVTTATVGESAAMNGPVVSAPSSSNARAPHAPRFDWAARLERADFDGILHDANEFGIDRCMSGCSVADLRILADAARYAGQNALSERSLLALRRRAPAEAATAAFLLARLFESRGEPQKALAWYDKHLREAPASAYAAEAWGGKMRMLSQIGGPRAARPAAEEYLARFPDGVQAPAARRILADADK
jgi:hypothetical protein